MTLKARISTLETRQPSSAPRIVTCSTAEEARLLDADGQIVIITGVPRHQAEARP